MVNYYNPYVNMSGKYVNELQNMRDKIDNQIQQVQQQQQNMQRLPIQQPITQNFQIAPNVNNEIEGKYANSIEDVKNTFVMKMGVFVNRDFSTLWIKNVNGDIRTFNTEEVFEMDEKDKEIMMLRKEIENMKGMISNAKQSDDTNIDDETQESKPKRVRNTKQSNAK